MTRPFYMKLNWAHYHRDTYGVLTTAAHHGAYLLLLGALFDAGGRLKATDALLAGKACCTPEQWAALKPVVLPFFKVSRGWLTHKRVSADLADIADGRGKRSEAGVLGGRASGESRRRAKALREAGASGNEAKPTESQSESQTPKAKALGSRRCPADWAPTPAALTLAYMVGLDGDDYDRELAKFRDHEFPKPRKDWSATFRNWLRQAAEWKARDVQRPDRADAKLAQRHANYAAAERGADLAAGRTWEP